MPKTTQYFVTFLNNKYQALLPKNQEKKSIEEQGRFLINEASLILNKEDLALSEEEQYNWNTIKSFDNFKVTDNENPIITFKTIFPKLLLKHLLPALEKIKSSLSDTTIKDPNESALKAFTILLESLQSFDEENDTVKLINDVCQNDEQNKLTKKYVGLPKTIFTAIEKNSGLLYEAYSQKIINSFINSLNKNINTSVQEWMQNNENKTLVTQTKTAVFFLIKKYEDDRLNLEKQRQDIEKNSIPSDILKARNAFLEDTRGKNLSSEQLAQLSMSYLLSKQEKLPSIDKNIINTKINQLKQTDKLNELLKNLSFLLSLCGKLALENHSSLSIQQWLKETKYPIQLKEMKIEAVNDNTNYLELFLKTINELPIPGVKFIMSPITKEAAEKYYQKGVDALSNTKEFNKALALLKIAKSIFQKINVTEETKEQINIAIGTCKSTIASCYRELGNSEKATKHCLKAISIFQQNKDTKKAEHALNKLESCLSSDPKDAQKLERKGEEIKGQGFTAVAAVFFKKAEKLNNIVQNQSNLTTISPNYNSLEK